MLLCSQIRCTLVQWLVLLTFQLLTLIGFQHLISSLAVLCQLAKHGIQKCGCHVIYISISRFYFCILLVRVYAECHVGRQGPRCGGPCQDISILTFYFKADNCRTFFDILISLGNLVGGKRGTAARAVGNDLESFIKETFIPDGFQRPPLRLDEVVIISNIRVIHISPETNGAGKILPHSLVFPDALFTFGDERIQTILLNLLFSVQSQKLFYFQLYRQSVGIPSCFSRYIVAFHGAVSRNHILDNTSEHVSDMWFSICGRRSIIEGIGRASFSLLHTLFECVVFFPELFYFFFPFHKVHVGVDFAVHVLQTSLFFPVSFKHVYLVRYLCIHGIPLARFPAEPFIVLETRFPI